MKNTEVIPFPVFVTRAEAKTKLSVTVRVDSKKVNKKTITMKIGSSKKIKLSLVPNQSGIKTKYQSDKKGIVTVSKTGRLKAKKAGTANALLEKMPMTLNMKELNGNEKYHYFDTEFPTNEKSPGKIENASGFAKAVGSGDVKITFQKGNK